MALRLFPRTRAFWYGLTLPWQAFKLILSKKRLLFWSAFPIGLTILLYIYLIGWMNREAMELLQSYFVQWGWDPEGWSAWIVNLLGKLALILISAVTFTFASTVVASPFNDFLAESTERWAKPKLPAPGKKSLRQQVELVGIDLVKTCAATAAGFAAIIFSLVPFLNVISFVLVFLLVCFQYTSYPQTRRGVPLREGFRFLFRHIYACTGFGMAVTFLFAIPFAGSFVLPLAVVSGTLLVARCQAPFFD